MYGDGLWEHIYSRKYIYGKWVHYTSYLKNSQSRVMYTIAFLKVGAFQLSKLHISTYKITRMVALSVSIAICI